MDSVKQIYLMSTLSNKNNDDYLAIGFGYHQDILVEKKNKDLVIMGRPDVDIIKSFETKVEISLKKRARGVNNDVARRQAEEIIYSYHVKDSILMLDGYFELPAHIKWRDQELDIILSLPVGTQIFLDETMRDLLQGVDNTDGLWSDEMLGKTWIMTDEGLTRFIEETE